MTPLFGDELCSHRHLAVMATLTEDKATGLRGAAGGISEWHVGYRWHANTAPPARISHEPLSWTAQLPKDSETTDEERWDIYLWKGPAVEKVWDKRWIGDYSENNKTPHYLLVVLIFWHFSILPYVAHSFSCDFSDGQSCSIVFSWLPARAEIKGQQTKERAEINRARIERQRGSFLCVGSHLPWSDPWIRGQGLVARSKLLHILNRLS